MKAPQILGVALLALVLCVAPIAHAQPADMTDELAMLDNEEPQWRAVPVVHIAPSLLAAWLDPKYQAFAPPWFTVGEKPTTENGALAMFADIAALVPVDAEKVVMVLGTEDETKALANIIATLDQPRAVVEFEIAVVAVDSKSAASALGVRGIPTAMEDADGNLVEMPIPATPFVAGANKEAIAQAQALVTAGKAVMLSQKLVKAPTRFATQTALTQSAPLDFQAPQISSKPKLIGAFREVSSLSIKPSEGAADSIALSLKTARHLMWVPAPETSATSRLALQTRDDGETVINVKDGETIALFGFRADAFPTDANFTPQQIADRLPANVIVLIQTRIVQ